MEIRASKDAPGPAGDAALPELIKTSTTTGFAKDVIEASRTVPVLVDFWAPWCGPCRAVAPVLEQLQDELTGRLKIVKVNVDENGEIAGALGIRSIPTLIVFKEGKAVEGAVGALSKQQMLEFLEPHLESSAA
jgi:putative thioredoxin